MSRYFFQVRDGTDYPDLQSTELPDLTTARLEGDRFAAALPAEKPEAFWDTGEWTMRVTDAKDLTLFQLTFFATNSAAAQ